MSDVSQLYLSAEALAEQGERVVCVDEMSGIQALERRLPDLPLRPGKVQRREARVHSPRHPMLNCQL